MKYTIGLLFLIIISSCSPNYGYLFGPESTFRTKKDKKDFSTEIIKKTNYDVSLSTENKTEKLICNIEVHWSKDLEIIEVISKLESDVNLENNEFKNFLNDSNIIRNFLYSFITKDKSERDSNSTLNNQYILFAKPKDFEYKRRIFNGFLMYDIDNYRGWVYYYNKIPVSILINKNSTTIILKTNEEIFYDE